MKVDEGLWNEFLRLRKSKANHECLAWAFNGFAFSKIKESNSIDPSFQAILFKREFLAKERLFDYTEVKIPFDDFSLFIKPNLSNEIQLILKNYWPLSILNHIESKMPFVFIHTAVSLDGFLATSSGHSHWIGNQENLVHAHRLRALFDGVLIGSKTVIRDNPSLNVRHVLGKNPVRLILSNECMDFTSLKPIPECKTFLLRDSKFSYNNGSEHFDKVIYFEGTTQEEKLTDLLQKCKQENINSILVEGGGSTISAFVESKLVNIIQFHLSPLLFGDGIKAVKLPSVNSVDETRKLENMDVTTMGDSFMITAAFHD